MAVESAAESTVREAPDHGRETVGKAGRATPLRGMSGRRVSVLTWASSSGANRG